MQTVQTNVFSAFQIKKKFVHIIHIMDHTGLFMNYNTSSLSMLTQSHIYASWLFDIFIKGVDRVATNGSFQNSLTFPGLKVSFSLTMLAE